jgi:hypothetical protein
MRARGVKRGSTAETRKHYTGVSIVGAIRRGLGTGARVIAINTHSDVVTALIYLPDAVIRTPKGK